MVTESIGMAKSFSNAELNNLVKKIKEVLKSSILENTFKSYTVGYERWTKWCKKFILSVFLVTKNI